MLLHEIELWCMHKCFLLRTHGSLLLGVPREIGPVTVALPVFFKPLASPPHTLPPPVGMLPAFLQQSDKALTDCDQAAHADVRSRSKGGASYRDELGAAVLRLQFRVYRFPGANRWLTALQWTVVWAQVCADGCEEVPCLSAHCPSQYP